MRFWDYSQVRWNLRGRICLPFSLAWSLLVAAGLPVIQAAIAPALAAVPPTATYAALLVFTADTVVSSSCCAGQEIPQCCLWKSAG
ncbi:MAG: putative ABC transporter permease [Dysosmobacter welbionis]